MAKVSTDPNLIERFLTRGVEAIYPSTKELEKKLNSGERLRVYQGFDPTGPFLHVGHAMGIRALGILQRLGHEVIFLIGDYTAKVGDPDKDTGRQILSDETIAKNMKGWKEQAAQLIDFEGENPVVFKHNYEWLSKLTLNDLINLMSKTTVQQMLERELFQKRIKAKNPIGLQEFIYPLMQGFDSVAMEVDIEIGGTDQTFNMLMGRMLVKSFLGKEKYVRTNQMMEAPEGLTMSKTKGNGINLSDTEENMFGKAMSYPDELITKAMNLLTEIPQPEIEEMEQAIKKGDNPMKYKKIMAFELVKLIKGSKAATKAQKYFEKTVQNKEMDKENTISVTIKGEMTVLDFLKNVKADPSVSQIKRIVEQGGVLLNEKQIINPNELNKFTKGDIIKFGKRKYFKVE